MNDRCEGCRHFVQHYRKQFVASYVPIGCGHCTVKRVRKRAPESPACEHYQICEKKAELMEEEEPQEPEA